MRFFGTLKFNGYVVGKGYGSNKKQVKQVASRLALMNLVPTLYRQWKAQMEPHGSPDVSTTEKASLESSSPSLASLLPSSLEESQKLLSTPKPSVATVIGLTPASNSLEKLKENIVPKKLFDTEKSGSSQPAVDR